MKIQLITRHYWPDQTPGARLHRAILEHLAQQGHDVRVFTAMPSSTDNDRPPPPTKQHHRGVEIRRVRLLPERKRWTAIRLLNLVYFQMRAIWDACRCSAELLMVSSYPPVVPGFCVWLVHRIQGTPYIYHCLDVQPESATLVGKLRIPGLASCLRQLDLLTCERAAAVVTLSEEMAHTLRGRGWHGQSIRLINNFHTRPLSQDERTANSSPAPRHDLLPEVTQHAFQVVFAGNMGSFQGLELLVDAAWKLRQRDDIQFVFMGAGERQAELEAQAGALQGQTVHFIPFQPGDVATSVVRGADLAVLSLLPEIFATAVPSKTMMYLRAGCPMLALIEPDCELGRLIRQHALGVVPAVREAQVVADAILATRDAAPQVTPAERQRIFKIGEALFGFDRTLDKWTRLVDQLDTAVGRKVPPSDRRRAA